MKIEIISGSPRTLSLTRRVAFHLQNLLKQQTDHEVSLVDMSEINLPPVQSVFTSVDAAPAEYREITKRVFAADAFVLVTPEYNGSYSPAMKNFLDHFPKQNHKVFGIVTASPGAFGGMRAAMQLQQLIFGLFGVGSPHMLVVPMVDKKFTEEGDLIDRSFEKSVDVFVREYLWLAEKLVEEKVTV